MDSVLLPFYIAMNLPLVTFTTLVSTLCWIVIFFYRNKIAFEKVAERREDVPHIEQRVPKKSNKKINTKKRKNRNSGIQSKQHNFSKNMDEQTEGNSTKIEPGEESDKRRNRARKKCTVSSKSTSENSGTQMKRVKTYSPLSLYNNLQLEPMELYNRFLPYVLVWEQLVENGFPIDSPDNPGKILPSKTTKFKKELEDPTERWCCRCGTKYTISENGLYAAETVCHYHWGKRLSIGGISGAGAYSCCGRNTMSEGCTCSKHHVSAQITTHNTKFVKTRNKRLPYPYYRVYGLDCEMCYTVQGLEVTRISVVGPDGLAIYDSYVLPENPVLDYNTTYSGITANDLKDVTTTLADVQAYLLKLLSARTILIGHGLENDLKALRLIHETVVDTSVVFPHQYGLPYKRSLKSLATYFLNRTIQDSDEGHDSVEDARTCIELMLWKIQSDNRQQFIQPSVHHRHHVISSPTPQWSSHITVNRIMAAPCTIGYWVPPVGSCCELY